MGLWQIARPACSLTRRKCIPSTLKGNFNRSRGSLNSGPCPQGRPVIAQAGRSARGRTFAAKHAETIVVHMKGVEQMKAYRDDVRKRMMECKRDPDSCKVLFLIAPILAETDEDAQIRAQRHMASAAKHVDGIAALCQASSRLPPRQR